MPIALEKSWSSILESSRAIELLAADEDWKKVTELASNRHQAIRQHFENFPVGPETANFYSIELSGFIAREDKLQEVVKKARKEALKSGTIINNRKKLLRSYR